jgi:predicted lactoylglutathione lyase
VQLRVLRAFVVQKKLQQQIKLTWQSKSFINLPVKELQQSVDFYTALGFTVNPQFSDNTATCMVWSDTIYVMLLTHEKFSSFTPKPIADTKSAIAGLFALSVDSVEEVNSIMTAGLAPVAQNQPKCGTMALCSSAPLKILTATPGKFSIWTFRNFPHSSRQKAKPPSKAMQRQHPVLAEPF